MVAGETAPEATVPPAEPVRPEAVAMRSMTDASATVCRPEYSSTVAPIE